MIKESKSCYTCQRQSYNLSSATCGHKICFYCVKGNKNSHKCSLCMSQTRPKTCHSPSRILFHEPKERSTKVKDSDSKLNSESSMINFTRSRPSPHKQSTGMAQIEQIVTEPLPQQILNCKQHSEPLSMYCKSAKELICSVCLCNKFKQSGDILPIRSAEQHLRKQNKLNRQQSKIILGNIENAQNIIGKNISIFRNCYNSSLQVIQNLFEQLHKEVQNAQKKARQQFLLFFDHKFKQCEQIDQDLTYLNSILRDFKDNNKDNCTFNELLYLFTSFKVIKSTVKNLNLDYLPYNKQIQIIETKKYQFKETLKEVIRFKFDLPLKLGTKKKTKTQSNKSASRSKQQDFDEVQRHGFSDKLKQRSSLVKRHQMSLCNNIHGIQIGEQERNLYKLLLKTKFKL